MADLSIENIITSVALDQSFDLDAIVDTFENARWHQEESSFVVFTFSDPRHVVLFTENGFLSCTGSTSETMGKETIDQLLHLLYEQGFIDTNSYPISVQTITASTSMTSSIDLMELMDKLPQTTLRNANEPAAYVEYIYDYSLTVLFFATGKIVINGSQPIMELENTVENIMKKLVDLGIIEKGMEEIHA